MCSRPLALATEESQEGLGQNWVTGSFPFNLPGHPADRIPPAHYSVPWILPEPNRLLSHRQLCVVLSCQSSVPGPALADQPAHHALFTLRSKHPQSLPCPSPRSPLRPPSDSVLSQSLSIGLGSLHDHVPSQGQPGPVPRAARWMPAQPGKAELHVQAWLFRRQERQDRQADTTFLLRGAGQF